MKWNIPKPALIALTLSVLPIMTQAETVYQASSDSHRTAILELYTSEGCSSCPPADEFVASLDEAGIGQDRVVPLSLHVDYWDYIGWKDPYANSEYTNRQRRISGRNNSAVYTPQLVLNGKNFRDINTFKRSLREINESRAPIELSMTASFKDTDKLHIALNAMPSSSPLNSNGQIFIGIAENSLTSRINAGENRGRTLKHEHVVRTLKGPYALNSPSETSLNEAFTVEQDWRRENLEVFAFVQNKSSGDVLQALALPLK